MAMATAGLALAIPCLCSSSPRHDRCTTSTASQSVPRRSQMSSSSHFRCDSSAGFSPSFQNLSRQRHVGPTLFVQAAQSSAKNENIANEDVDKTKERLRELSESLVLPASFLEKLPSDLRVDLKDAAFALASGALNKECGEQAGDLLMQLSRTWERGDTQAAAAAAAQLPSLLGKLPSESSFQFVGKRFTRAGRHFTTTGKYESGELQKIGKALISAGEAFSGGNLPVTEDATISTAKIFKFGDLQVDISARRAYIGAGISLAFGLLSWQLTSRLQNLSESSTQSSNDNALLLATSLRGTLLAAGYACTVLSAFAMVGLLVIASGLNEDKK